MSRKLNDTIIINGKDVDVKLLNLGINLLNGNTSSLHLGLLLPLLFQFVLFRFAFDDHFLQTSERIRELLN